MITRTVVCGVALVLAASCSSDNHPDSDPGSEASLYRPPHAQQEPPVAGTSQPPPAIVLEATAPAFQPRAPVWPDADLVEVAGQPPGGGVRLGGMALQIEDLRSPALAAVRPLAPLTIQSFSRAATTAAGIDGVLVRISTPGGLAAV